MDRYRKDQGCALGVLSVSLSNGISRAVHRFLQLSGGIVTISGMDRAQIIADIHSQTVDVAEVTALDSPPKISLEDDLRVDFIKPDFIAPVGGSCKADVLIRVEVVVDLPISLCSGVMGFIGDNHVKLTGREAIQPIHKGLNGSDYHFLTVAMILGDLESYGAIVVFGRLPDQFFTVSQYQDTTTPGDVGKGRRLTAACGHLAEIGTGGLGFNDGDALLLVVTELHFPYTS